MSCPATDDSCASKCGTNYSFTNNTSQINGKTTGISTCSCGDFSCTCKDGNCNLVQDCDCCDKCNLTSAECTCEECKECTECEECEECEECTEQEVRVEKEISKCSLPILFIALAVGILLGMGLSLGYYKKYVKNI